MAVLILDLTMILFLTIFPYLVLVLVLAIFRNQVSMAVLASVSMTMWTTTPWMSSMALQFVMWRFKRKRRLPFLRLCWRKITRRLHFNMMKPRAISWIMTQFHLLRRGLSMRFVAGKCHYLTVRVLDCRYTLIVSRY